MKAACKLLFVLLPGLIFHNALIAQNQVIQLNKAAKGQVIDSISDKLKANYIYLDTALKMAAFIKHQFNKGNYDTIKTPSVFASVLTGDLLSVYKDKHLSVNYDPGFSSGSAPINKIDVQKQLDRRLKFRKRVNFGFDKAEMLPGGIGYLKIAGFFAPDKESKEMADAALKFVSNSDALIIDLRNNMGGDPDMVAYICRTFFKEKTHLNDFYERRINLQKSSWTTPDTAFNSLADIPLYILTNNATFSAGEEFAYDLQAQKRATIVGEATGGGAHPVQPFAVGNGFVANIPFARAINPISKTNWEMVGVKPDIAVEQDRALDVAISKAEAINH